MQKAAAPDFGAAAFFTAPEDRSVIQVEQQSANSQVIAGMNRSSTAVGVTTFALFVATLASGIPGVEPVTVILVTVSPLLILWMVFAVLRDKPLSDKRFSDGHFYEDSTIRGIPEPEEPENPAY